MAQPMDIDEQGVAQDNSQLLANAAALPLAERVAHSNRIIREAAFESIKSSFLDATDGDDSRWDENGK